MQKLLSNIISNDYYTFQELMEPRAGCLSQSFVLNIFIEDSSSSNDIFWNRFRQIEPLVSVQVSIFEETRFFPCQKLHFVGDTSNILQKTGQICPTFQQQQQKRGGKGETLNILQKTGPANHSLSSNSHTS